MVRILLITVSGSVWIDSFFRGDIHMTFEERFPSLTVGDGYDPNSEGDYSFVSTEDIEKHCLDKQRVRETIDDEITFLEYVLKKDSCVVGELVNTLGVNVAIKALKDLKTELGL